MLTTSMLVNRKETVGMDRYLNEFKLVFARLERRHVQLFILILTLILFVLGAGAPGAGGDVSG